ncbi:1-phosphofructokinase family hexose kinase [Cryobacterium sp. HLT2-28]|uniref:1-phosphofructokinase family hexose kinase n=1 Tax=Cryobacterium sp. HLT2-28 TaxID=1259146 RepID=UPI00106907C1|nr:1-phosphofructokinase family hexose kinase [Cryobacterium sp. HLT2-28]TFB91567.1 1-phosphofructokinase family hexose kinase [Cryobacterium sp. HLT2-28]
MAQDGNAAGAIITVTPNPAVDVTYRLPHAVWGGVNRVDSVTRRAGGKGVNVACVLAQLGHAAQTTGFLGGANGQSLSQLLDSYPIEQQWTPIEGETRCTTVVVDESSTTLLNEPGPRVSGNDWDRISAEISTRCSSGDVVVLSGSFPPGTQARHVQGFVSAARRAGALILVDTSGPLLGAAADSGADLLKPNQEELREATGIDDVVAGARSLIARGAGTVAVSCGEEGLVVVTGRGEGVRAWRAAPAEIVHGNPTGAGDAAVAALALLLQHVAAGGNLAEIVPDHLRQTVALSAAAVVAPVAGVVDLASYARFLSQVEVEEIHVPL